MSKLKYAFGLLCALALVGTAHAQTGAMINSVTLSTNLSGSQTLSSGSYRSGLSFGSNLTPIQLNRNASNLALNVSASGNQQVGFVWNTSKDRNATRFDMNQVANLATYASFSSSNQLNLTLTDFYKDKWVYMLVFVRNNDGVSLVPGMPVEVDDVMPVLVFIGGSGQDNDDEDDDNGNNDGNNNDGNNNNGNDNQPRYEGKDGTMYRERDFRDNSMRLVGFDQAGRAHFFWTPPAVRYDGYALFVTEGNFHGGLHNYSPIYLGKDATNYTYPPQFNTKTKVTAHLYAYIELKNGARKFIQPGRREVVQVRNFFSVPTPPPTTTPPVPPPSVCGTESGNDGVYHVCLGDTVIHTNSNTTFRLTAGSGGKVNVEVSQVGTFSVMRNGFPLIVETQSGEVLELRLTPVSSNNTLMLSILTLTQFKRGDVTMGADGTQVLFVGDSFTHASSGIRLSVDWYQRDTAERVRLSVSGAAGVQQTLLSPGTSIMLRSNTGMDVRVTLVGLSLASRTITLLVETVIPPQLCGDERGGNGVYTLCVGDELFHEPTGVNIEVVYHLRFARFAHVQISGTATSSAYVSHWFPVTVQTSSGQKLRITYLGHSSDMHVVLRVETVQ